MIFNKSTEHALRTLIYMNQSKRTLFSTRELSTELHIPYKYLGRILPRLSRAKILQSIQGKDGGYTPLADLGKMKLSDIIIAVDDKPDFKKCAMGFEECSSENPCAIHHRWLPIRDKMTELVEDVILEDILKDKFLRV